MRALDLVREFALLHDERSANGGVLPTLKEKRWRELAVFCDRLLGSRGQAGAGSASEWTRASLRVPAEVDMFFQSRGEYYTGQLVNLSRGGIFLGSPVFMTVGSPLVLFLANLGREALLEARGEVVWIAEKGLESCGLPRGMGVRFVGFSDVLARRIESFIFETIERRLASVDMAALDPRLLPGNPLTL